ncbi:MAG TPA: hypothetical protein ENJ27_00050 [Candidatus Moranbacteria bacterium]|nr:hypothetical protein [Candidatus Moranbacteria bacterium]
MWELITIQEMNRLEAKIKFCSNCGTKLNVEKKREQDRIPCPCCQQTINSAGEILKIGRDLSLPQIW